NGPRPRHGLDPRIWRGTARLLGTGLLLVVKVLTFLALLAVAGLASIAMAPETRERLRLVVMDSIRQVRQEATRSRPEIEQFRAALRDRTRWALLTPALVALNVIVFVLI